jgi:cysteinyl-tRNA synthetase
LKLFVCGPTVYDYSHLGHAKTYTQFDFVARYLSFRGYDIFYLQNITDVDDKIIQRARAKGVNPRDLAAEFESYYFEDMRALHNTNVTEYARAHDYIEQIVSQVKRLAEKGYAYKIPDGWYYDLSRFPGYGKLSRRTEVQADDALSRVDENPDKRNPGDFCLWKMRKPDEPFWVTDLGEGRPGWHIEDTAITESVFGPQYDMHGGAVDLIFPHHEAEIAQMEAVSGLEPMVTTWMHTGFLKTVGARMAKSAGNFVTIREALAEYDYRVLRYFFISHHYRSPIDFTPSTLENSGNALERIDAFVRSTSPSYDDEDSASLVTRAREAILSRLDDDFDTPGALAAFFDFVREQNRRGHPGRRVYTLLAELNGFFDFMNLAQPDLNAEVSRQVERREVLRKERRFQEADQIRNALRAKGIQLEDTPTGVRWWRDDLHSSALDS